MFPCPDFVRQLIEYFRRFFSPVDHDHDAEYPPLGHDHDDTYYTESEVDTLLSGKADDPPVNDDRYYTESEVDALLASIDGAIVGEIRMFARLSLPSGWLPCDGTSYLQTAYPELFSAIGVYWGGDATHFDVPDFRGRFPLSQGNGYVFAQNGGEEEHALTEPELPPHNHPVRGTTSGTYNSSWANSLIQRANNNVVSVNYTGDVGSGEAHNNMPPFLALGFAIYAGE